MRATSIVVCAGLLAACSAPSPAPAPIGAAPVAACQNLDAWQKPDACQNPDEGAVTHQDREILRQLERELNRLAEAGETATLATLHGQLGRRRCDLDLVPVREQSGSSVDVHARAMAGTLVVAKRYKCGKCPNWHVSAASGFAISSDGAFVTCHHVVTEDEDTAIAVMDSQGVVRPVVEVLAADRAADVAILRMKCDEPFTAALPLREAVAVAEPVYVLSHPANSFWYFTAGLVSRRFAVRRGRGSSAEMLDITADFARGSSGGPVLDARGNVVGVVSATTSIYYDEKDDRPSNLQMVRKQCSPADAVRALID